MTNDITKKGRIGQFFCKHTNKGWCKESPGKFETISGETHYHICRDCGKVISKHFALYEGMGFK